MVSNRFIIGIVAFGVSFGLTLVITWNFYSAIFTGIVTILATYAATFIVEKRRRNYELLVLDSFHKRIKELENIKHSMTVEISQLEAHRRALATESNQLQHQVSDRRNQRDSLNRELSTFALQKKQLESEFIHLQDEFKNIEKSKEEANNSYSNIAAEKRRLELNCNVSKAEITQLHAKIGELLHEQEELENNLTLLNRLKPQLEEKLYELRVQLQELEIEEKQQQELLSNRHEEQEQLEENLKLLETQKIEDKQELEELQSQISLLQEERDLLQNQVWELLQQLENLNQQPSKIKLLNTQEETEAFPFADFIETISIEATETKESSEEELPKEWMALLERLLEYEIEVLKVVLEQENPNSAIKKIAEDNITMPNLLIDSINERAQETIGELIISTTNDIPEIDREYEENIQRLIANWQDIESKHPSSN
ncbi:MAG: tellurite resistance TerB C-terminal domain-containing protein [Cyanobacteria bacterium P01_D01_bin.50]